MQPEYKYYAFISYNWKDLEWGKKLQKKIRRVSFTVYFVQ